jgi:hypothetical protein
VAFPRKKSLPGHPYLSWVSPRNRRPCSEEKPKRDRLVSTEIRLGRKKREMAATRGRISNRTVLVFVYESGKGQPKTWIPCERGSVPGRVF